MLEISNLLRIGVCPLEGVDKMQIEYLYYFLDVVRTQSFTQSAKGLYISPQGLSQAIKTLEKKYNIELFTRSKRGLVLTDDGNKFATYVNELLKCYENFEEQCKRIKPVDGTEMGNILTIYTTALFSVSGIILEIVENFFEKCPDKTILISEKLPFDVIKSMKNDQNYSIGLVNVPNYLLEELSLFEEVCIEYILEISLVASVSPTSVYANKKFFTKQELTALPLSCFNEPLLEDCIQYMLGEYGEPNIVMCCSNVRLSKDVAYSQDIIYISVNLTKDSTPENRVLVPIHDALKLTVILLYPKKFKDIPIMKKLIHLMKSFLLENYPHLAV